MRSWFGARGVDARPEGPSPAEIVTLARRYLIQETIGPLRVLLKSLALGAAGALAFGLGSVIALFGVLRVLETETGRTFAGNWSFAPYLLTAVCGVLVIGAAVFIGLRSTRDGRRRD